MLVHAKEAQAHNRHITKPISQLYICRLLKFLEMVTEKSPIIEYACNNNNKLTRYWVSSQFCKLTSDSLAYKENQLHLEAAEHYTVLER
jgi:hypothetical protein